MNTHLARDDRGTTLVEVLVTVVIMGLAITALLGGLGTAVIVSDQHRQQAVAGAAVRSYAEAVGATTYVPCATPTTAGYRLPPGYDPLSEYPATIVGVQYWNATDRVFETLPQASPPKPACQAATDAGAQKVTVRVQSNRGRATATLDVIVRKAGA